jgi:hypothetical protein
VKATSAEQGYPMLREKFGGYTTHHLTLSVTCATHRHWPKVALGLERVSESSHFVEKGAATIDMHTKGLQILLHRHSCAGAKFLRISAQQFYAVFVEPLGAFDDAAQIFCMGQSIEALEVLSSEVGDNRSMIVIAENSPVYHGRFPGWV